MTCFYCIAWDEHALSNFANLEYLNDAEDCPVHVTWFVTRCDECAKIVMSDARHICLECDYRRYSGDKIQYQGSPNRRWWLSKYGLENFEG